MLYYCFTCEDMSFSQECTSCGPEQGEQYVPLHIEDYQEFNYESSGILDSLFKKKRRQQELDDLKEEFKSQYEEFRVPYFKNFLRLTDSCGLKPGDPARSDRIDVFLKAVDALGLDTLENIPGRTKRQMVIKLLRTEALRSKYSKFKSIFEAGLNGGSLKESVTSFMEKREDYRSYAAMILYFCCENNCFREKLKVTVFEEEGEFRELLTERNVLKFESYLDEIREKVLAQEMLKKLENYEIEN